MERFVYNQNIIHFRAILAETMDDEKRKQVLQLLAKEEAKRDLRMGD